MSYFNHAYVKAAVIKSTEPDADETTQSLDPSQLGVVDPATYETITFPTSGTSTVFTNNQMMLVFGNYNQVDTLGGNPLHGGYAESIKTKVIKKNYVTALWKQECVAANTDVITITIPDDCIDCANESIQNNLLRLDIKGEETLRFLNRFSYSVYDYSECCDTDETTAGFHTGADIATAWAAAINADPLMGAFVTATAGTNVLTLTLSYTPTFFDNCSYDTRDYVGKAPLNLIVSVVNDGGNPCLDTCLTAAVDGTAVVNFGENNAYAVSTKAETSGATVLNEIILEGRYRQDGGWNQGNKDSARFREIQNNALLECGSAQVDRAAFYTCYYLQHSVPRFNNPTGVFDNDQYLYKFYVLCTSDEIASMDFLWDSIAAETGVSLAILP
jgi:hypothetical protein